MRVICIFPHFDDVVVAACKVNESLIDEFCKVINLTSN